MGQNLSDSPEDEIPKLEAEQVHFLMNDRVAEMGNNWASGFTITSPAGQTTIYKCVDMKGPQMANDSLPCQIYLC